MASPSAEQHNPIPTRDALSPAPDGKIRVGIAAMEKKARSKPMNQIMRRFDPGVFEFVIFGDHVLLHEPVETWPVVDYLFAWHSTNYPMQKVASYVRLRDPYLINDVGMQHELLDRRRVYAILEQNDIPTPPHVILEDEDRNEETLKECDDWIEVHGVRFNKPVVEKPVDAENHNIYIYYPLSAGGGSKRLFRKVGNKSSEFYPDVNELRKSGSYIYEEFMKTQGVDVKVYTVGPNYGHAEARKSPVIDGKVNRNDDGSEVRYPVLLSQDEKTYANKVVMAFKQAVCGFDILRVNEKSYVCDVNGWSFVKKSQKYFDDCAQLLSEIMISTVRHKGLPCKSAVAPLMIRGASWTPSPAPQYISPSNDLHNPSAAHIHAQPRSRSSSRSAPPANPRPNSRSAEQDGGNREELRCVIGVIRHGDRTPKQKLKFIIDMNDAISGDPVFEPFFKYFHEMVGLDMATLDKDPNPTQAASASSDIKRAMVGPSSPADKKEGAAKGLAVASGGGAGADGAAAAEGSEDQQKQKEREDMKAYSLSEGTTYSKHEGKALLADLKQEKHPHQGSLGLDRPASPMPLAVVWEKFYSPKKTPRPWDKDSEAPLSLADHAPSPRKIEDAIPNPGKKKAKGSKKAKSTKVKSKEGLHKFLTITEGIFEKLFEVQNEYETRLELMTNSGDERSSSLFSDPDAASVASHGEGEEMPKVGEATITSLLYKLQQIRDVLGRGEIAGLTRKLQLKALAWAEQDGPSATGIALKTGMATRLQIILKWSGALTPLGEAQAQWLGENLRKKLYPDPRGGGVLRLHSTFRHDLKIKTSDEGRVMKTAAAFTKGMLELEGSLIPILVSLVRKEKDSLHMLDPTGNDAVRADVDRCKDFLNQHLQQNAVLGKELIHRISFAGQHSVLEALRELQALGSPRRVLVRMHTLIGELVEQLETVVREGVSGARKPQPRLYMGETPLLMLDRWRKLHKDLYQPESQSFDLTKIPDVHDNIRYDMEHNFHRLPLRQMRELYTLAKCLADCYVPQEYGRSKREKVKIGAKMCMELLNKLKYDLILGTRDETHMDMHYMLDPSHAQYLDVKSLARRVRTRLYFTSESHLHTLVNVLRLMPQVPNGNRVIDKDGERILSRMSELCYLTHLVIRVFENMSKPLDDPSRFRVELGFSSGVDRTPRGLIPEDRDSDAEEEDADDGGASTDANTQRKDCTAAKTQRKDSFGGPSKFFENNNAQDMLHDMQLLRVSDLQPLNKSLTLTADELESAFQAAIDVATLSESDWREGQEAEEAQAKAAWDLEDAQAPPQEDAKAPSYASRAVLPWLTSLNPGTLVLGALAVAVATAGVALRVGPTLLTSFFADLPRSLFGFKYPWAHRGSNV